MPSSGGLRLRVNRPKGPGKTGGILVSIRPRNVRVLKNGGAHALEPTNVFRARVRYVEYLGPIQRLVVESESGMILTLNSGLGDTVVKNGESELLLDTPPEKIRLLDA